MFHNNIGQENNRLFFPRFSLSPWRFYLFIFWEKKTLNIAITYTDLLALHTGIQAYSTIKNLFVKKLFFKNLKSFKTTHASRDWIYALIKNIFLKETVINTNYNCYKHEKVILFFSSWKTCSWSWLWASTEMHPVNTIHEAILLVSTASIHRFPYLLCTQLCPQGLLVPISSPHRASSSVGEFPNWQAALPSLL